MPVNQGNCRFVGDMRSPQGPGKYTHLEELFSWKKTLNTQSFYRGVFKSVEADVGTELNIDRPGSLHSSL